MHIIRHTFLIMMKAHLHLLSCGILYLVTLMTTTFFVEKNGVFGLPTIPRNLKQCDACIPRKHCKQPFHDSTSRACRKLGLINYDLCGHMHVPSTNDNKYIMYFMRRVYLLKDKSQVFETYKKFHVWIQNEVRSHIGSLCTDNGREYTSDEFENYLHQHGIKHKTAIPYNPQQNGT
jgi:hypothetical protein